MNPLDYLAAIDSRPDDYRRLQALQASTAPATPTRKKGRGGFLTSLISEVGGTGGAAGGAAIGTALLPGVGTVLGAGVGGLAGALTGRLAENKVRDDEFRAGDALKEGLLTGALSAAFPAAGLAKNALKGGAEQAVEKAATRTALERSSEGMLGKAWGIRPGVKIAGEAVTPQRAAQLQKFVIEGVKVPKAANADVVLEHLTNFQDEAGRGISNVLQASKAKVNTKALASNLESKFAKVVGGDVANNSVAQDILKRAKSAKSPSELWELRKGIDEALINFGRNPNTAVPGAEQFARAARGEINNVLKTAVPEYGGLAKNFSRASDAAELVAAATRTPRGASLPGVLRSVAGEQVQSARALGGRVVGGAANAERTLAGALSSVKSPLAANALSGVLRQSPNNTDMTATMAQNQSSVDNITDPLSANGEFESIPEPPRSPFDPENAQKNVEHILSSGGKMKDVEEYLSLVDALSKINAGPKQPKLNATQLQQANNSNSALADIQQIRQQLTANPSTALKNALPGGGLARRLTGTTGYEAARQNVADALGRLRSGGAINSDEERRFLGLLPGAFDDPQAAEEKLRRLESLFAAFANPQEAQPDYVTTGAQL